MGPFRQGTGASCLGWRQAATTAATVWIAELAVMPRPGRWRPVPTARWCRCGVGHDGAILPLVRRQAARRRGLAAWLPSHASGAVGDSNTAAILFAALQQGAQAGALATAHSTSVPPLFAWRRNTGFGTFVEFGRQGDHALNQGADFWNDALQTPHFREFGDTNILFLPLVELS